MSLFRELTQSPPGSKFILQGNAAFALGVVNAGYHAADGYPGTPSTEVIDKSLKFVQDKIKVGWSVSEAVAVSVCIGHSIAGFDAVVTMKIPGVFQAADVISSFAFFTGEAGALVIYAATDYTPSSTQHIIDARYFFSSLCIPILEPRNHQEMYDIAAIAADISRKFRTPVVILASGTLTHSEGLIELKQPRQIQPRNLPADLKDWMCMPHIARSNYNKVIQERIPAIEKWIDYSNLFSIIDGTNDFGIITCGVNDIILNEALQFFKVKPSILSLAITNPIPKKIINEFCKKINGQIFVIEDGYRFLWEKIKLIGLDVIGKDETSTITEWTPDKLIEFITSYLDKQYVINNHYFNFKNSKKIDILPVARPPSICPGCPYRAVALTIQ